MIASHCIGRSGADFTRQQEGEMIGLIDRIDRHGWLQIIVIVLLLGKQEIFVKISFPLTFFTKQLVVVASTITQRCYFSPTSSRD
jgi:hypothetical protein